MTDSESDAEDMVGGASVCAPLPKPAARAASSVGAATKVRMHGKQRVEASGSRTTPPAPEPSEITKACHLCEESSGLTSVMYRGFLVHNECRNAIRAHWRLLETTMQKEKQRELDKLFWSDPPSWRKLIVPLVAGPGQKRTSAQRAEVRAAAGPSDEYRIVETIRESWRAPMQSYIAWKVMWHRMSEDEAQEAFMDALHEQQSDFENSDGEPTALIEEIPRQRITTGRRMGGTSSGGLAADLRSTTRAISESSAPIASARKRRRPEPSPSRRFEHQHDDDMDDEHPPPPKIPKTNVRKLTADALRAHSSRRSADGTSAPSQVELLQARSDLLREVKLFAKEATGPKKPYSILEKRIVGVPQERLDLLDLKPHEALKTIKETLLIPLADLQRDMTKLHLSQVEAKKAGTHSLWGRGVEWGAKLAR